MLSKASGGPLIAGFRLLKILPHQGAGAGFGLKISSGINKNKELEALESVPSTPIYF